MKAEEIPIPSLYFAHEREVVIRNGTILAVSEFVQPRDGETVERKRIRFRTMGDATITGAVESDADDMSKIIEEVAAARETERGNRADDKRSESYGRPQKARLLLIPYRIANDGPRQSSKLPGHGPPSIHDCGIR